MGGLQAFNNPTAGWCLWSLALSGTRLNQTMAWSTGAQVCAVAPRPHGEAATRAHRDGAEHRQRVAGRFAAGLPVQRRARAGGTVRQHHGGDNPVLCLLRLAGGRGLHTVRVLDVLEPGPVSGPACLGVQPGVGQVLTACQSNQDAYCSNCTNKPQGPRCTRGQPWAGCHGVRGATRPPARRGTTNAGAGSCACRAPNGPTPRREPARCRSVRAWLGGLASTGAAPSRHHSRPHQPAGRSRRARPTSSRLSPSRC